MFGGFLREEKGQYYYTAATSVTVNWSIAITTTKRVLGGVARIPGEGHPTHSAGQVIMEFQTYCFSFTG